MGAVFEAIDGEVRAFIERQHVFFVASAPLAGDGHVNLSPKGLDALRVLDARTLVYLDTPGSGVETVAHARENGRVVLMWCAFEGPPKIVRVHGRAEVVAPGTADFDAYAELFEFPREHVRAFVRITALRISDSCGYGVPEMRFAGERRALPAWTSKRGTEGLADYQRGHNARSLDGLPGVDWL